MSTGIEKFDVLSVLLVCEKVLGKSFVNSEFVKFFSGFSTWSTVFFFKEESLIIFFPVNFVNPDILGDPNVLFPHKLNLFSKPNLIL